MKKLSFVIGAPASGKTHFINVFFEGKDIDILDIYDYQQKAYDEIGNGKIISRAVEFRCLMKANNVLLNDIIEKLKQGRNVVVEQTFFKAKRRIVYIDAIREVCDVEIDVYVMDPSSERWRENIKKRKMEDFCDVLKKNAEEIEFPNSIEGFDSIYEVTDKSITLRLDPPKDSQFLINARKQISDEKERIKEEDELFQKRRELLESMKTRPFWHYCEVCGKKEFITDEDAYKNGWDYPPKTGCFGMLGPRTCGKCLWQDTLHWRILTSGNPTIVMEEKLTDKELITWRRIKGEPDSLLKDEKE